MTDDEWEALKEQVAQFEYDKENQADITAENDRLQRELEAQNELIGEMARCMAMRCKGYWERQSEEILNRPDVKKIMEIK